VTEDTTHEDQDGPTTDRDQPSISDPEQLRDREDVAVVEGERTFGREQFYALRRRYGAIEGVVQVGITNDEGEVLLWGNEEWSPPGGDVEKGEEWASAARRTMEELLGVSVRIDGVERVEFTDFCLEGDEDERFRADTVFFEASVVDAPGFVADPTVPEDMEHKYFPDPEEVSVAWFDEVTEDVTENHAEHVRLFLA
jgi:ADP-ribose pyrophosphatase YjhB (NUDIX family)